MPLRPDPAHEELSRSSLTREELSRYARHLSLPEVGLAGQERLKAARVLVVGAGGLGSPAALYLAAAGVGTIGLVDFDFVDRSNLQRQILFGESDVGRGKLDAAAERLRETNPHLELELHPARVERGNVQELVDAYDLVVDGTDNFPTRYLVHDATFFAGKPYVYGSIFRFEGQASLFERGRGPCYRCLFPEPPPAGAVPSCNEAGVIGVLPGIVGSIQANEAIKRILGIGETLAGRLLLFDALAMRFRELRLQRRGDCPLCGDAPTQRELVEYADACSPDERDAAIEIDVRELALRLAGPVPPALLDVRLPHETRLAPFPGAIEIPLHELPARLGELPRDRPLVALCHLGARSLLAVELLRDRGFVGPRNLTGGIDAWSREIDPTVPRY